MAKKARRKKGSVLTQAQLEGTRIKDEVTAEKVVIQTPVSEPTTKATVDFRQEYQYVVADLKRIGVLAAFMLAVLIALNLMLR